MRSESFGEEWFAGPTAVLEVGRHTLVVSSRAVSLYDRSFFYAHGQETRGTSSRRRKITSLPAPYVADWCVRMVNVDAPGSSSAKPSQASAPHALPRPYFRWMPNVTFHSESEAVFNGSAPEHQPPHPMKDP